MCLTVWDYNRNYILERYPEVDADKVVGARLGVEVFEVTVPPLSTPENNDAFRLLAVGHLHAVKDHAFLVRFARNFKRAEFPLTV